MLSRTTTWLYAASVGAGAMFLFDPARGRRRRAEVGRRAHRAAHVVAHAAVASGKDVGHRAAGMKARLQSAMSSSDEPSDQVLVARVRSALGRAVSHPGAIGVLAHDGTVTLDGPVLSDEADNVVWALRHVRGVRRLVNHLTPHETSGTIPSLQGRGTAPRLESLAATPSLRSPAARLISASAAMALLAWGAAAMVRGHTAIEPVEQPASSAAVRGTTRLRPHNGARIAAVSAVVTAPERARSRV